MTRVVVRSWARGWLTVCEECGEMPGLWPSWLEAMEYAHPHALGHRLGAAVADVVDYANQATS